MINTVLDDCRLIEFQELALEDGFLTSVSAYSEIPFGIKRVFFLKNMSPSASRGNHANIQNQVVLIALRGEFEITLHDGENEKSFVLNDSAHGLLVREFIWREIKNFSSDAICMVICSEVYDPSDYITDLTQFVNLKAECRDS